MGFVGIAGKFGALAGLSPFQLLAAQVSLLVPVAAVALFHGYGRSGFVPKRAWILVVRTLGGFTYFVSFYWALKGITVAEALVLESTNPFFAALIARLFLKRRLGLATGAMMIVAFGGVCLILIHHNAKDLMNPYSLLALLAGLGRAVGSVATGVAGRTEPAERIIFYYAAGMLLLSGAALGWESSPVHGHGWWILAATALLFVPQNLAYTVANRLIAAHLVGALFYVAILVGVVADRVLWKATLDSQGVFGMVLVVGAGLGLVWIQAKTKPSSQSMVSR